MNSSPGYLRVVALISIVSLPVLAAEPAETIEQLKACARISESNSRSSCYEKLGERVLAEDADSSAGDSIELAPAQTSSAVVVVSEPVVETAATQAKGKAAPTSRKMEDDMGGYKFQDKPSDHPDNVINTQVVHCQQDMDKAWYFKFENGQVWKQVDGRTLRLSGCEFPVIVSRDGFGYKMQIEGKGTKIRISRRK